MPERVPKSIQKPYSQHCPFRHLSSRHLPSRRLSSHKVDPRSLPLFTSFSQTAIIE